MQEEHVAVADGENEVRHTDYIYIVSDKMLVISMIAELDHHLADEMREVIDDVIDVRGVEDIIFDFSRINFMDSAGIGLIMGRYRKIHEKGGYMLPVQGKEYQEYSLFRDFISL